MLTTTVDDHAATPTQLLSLPEDEAAIVMVCEVLFVEFIVDVTRGRVSVAPVRPSFTEILNLSFAIV